jgi:mannuronan 5-epimerase
MKKLLLLITGILLPLFLLYPSQNISSTSCLEFQQAERTVEVSCGTANIRDLHNAFGSSIIKNESPKIWVLNSNVRIMNDATFYINSSDTLWLKINSTSGDAYSIISQGNLRIDSAKITGWNTVTDDYAKISNLGTEPRSFIRIEKGTGTSDIRNSELGYLGYNGSKSSGLSYYSGSGSTISNNKIHDLWNGFYSASIGNIAIKDNQFYDNIIYGIDPHSATHDSSIVENKVHNNGWHGIICSKHCYNITIDSNTVFGNSQSGIVLHGNTTNSTIAENIVYDNIQDQISLQNSADNNLIYNNTLSAGTSGFEVAESSNNNIYGNSIKNAEHNVFIHNGSKGNQIESNDINNADNFTLYIRDGNSTGNIFEKNRILTYPTTKVMLVNNTSAFVNNTVGGKDAKYEFTLMNKSELVLLDNIMSQSGGVIKSEFGYEPLPLSAKLQSKKSALDEYLRIQNLTD